MEIEISGEVHPLRTNLYWTIYVEILLTTNGLKVKLLHNVLKIVDLTIFISQVIRFAENEQMMWTARTAVLQKRKKKKKRKRKT